MKAKEKKWRRGWDLNPRARFCQATRFRGGLFQPLRHLSRWRDFQLNKRLVASQFFLCAHGFRSFSLRNPARSRSQAGAKSSRRDAAICQRRAAKNSRNRAAASSASTPEVTST
jgi:hypothetical protein